MVASGSELQALAPQLGDIDMQALAPVRRSDYELVDLLQRRVAAGGPSPDSILPEMDVYSADPRDILGDGEQEALCFSTVESAGGGSTHRRKREAASPVGGAGGELRCWHQDHGKKPIQDRAYKRTLNYVSKTKNANPREGQPKFTIVRLGYIMIEYELKHQDAGAKNLVLCKVYRSPRTNPETAMAAASCAAPEPPRPMQAAVSKLAGPNLRLSAMAACAVQVAPSSILATRYTYAPKPSMRRWPLRARVKAAVPQHGVEKPAIWPTVVMKFGRSSLASAERIKKVANLLRVFNTDTPVVVLSAMGETTDNLLQAGHQAMRCDAEEVCKIHELVGIKKFHLSTVHKLGLPSSTVSGTLDLLERQLKRIARTKDLSAKKLDCLLSIGELLSTKILSAYLNELGTKTLQYNVLDLGLTTADKSTDILQATYSAIAEQLEGDWIDEPAMPIIPGFLGKEWELCAVTTFGKGVSDLTAVAIGRALESREIQIWKEMEGLLTCDPNICSNAIPIPFLTFHEAAELAHCAQVLHPDTRGLAREGGIPVRVKNFCNPHSPGTLITTTRDMCKSTLTGIVVESNITVLDIESTRKLGQNGVLANVLSILEGSGISVDYMATDKGKMSLALDPSKLLSCGLIQPVLDNIVEELQETAVVHVLEHRSVVSLVGNTQMSPDILGMASNVLMRIGVKVQMISQSSSNSEVVKISLLVHDSEAKDCVQALHSTFFDNGFVSEAEEAENKYSPTAASSSGVKRRKLSDMKHSVPVEGDICDHNEPSVDDGDSDSIAEECVQEPIRFDNGLFPRGTDEGQQGLPEAEMMEGGSVPSPVLGETENSNQETMHLKRIALKPSLWPWDNGGDSTGSVAAETEVEDNSVPTECSDDDQNSVFSGLDDLIDGCFMKD